MLCVVCICYVFFFKQKTAYEMRISDWSSDVCSSDLRAAMVDAELGMAKRAHAVAGRDRAAPGLRLQPGKDGAGQIGVGVPHVEAAAAGQRERRVRPVRRRSEIGRAHV